jgi:hypothetical protein
VKVWDAATGLEALTLKGHTGPVTSVAFWADGQRLASGSEDRTVKVWDAATGLEVLTLKGHTGAVWSVAFSADGRRLASGSDDQTVKVWDAATGQETLTLKGHTNGVWSVAFSPDGRRLASGSEDRTVKVWDARERTPGLLLEREARSILDFLYADGQTLEDLMAAIGRDQGLSEAVRQQALAWGPTYWDRAVCFQAESLLQRLSAKWLLRSDLEQRLRAETSSSELVRQKALALAKEYLENPRALNHASWRIASSPGATPEEYLRALRYAEAAARVSPEDLNILNSLGVAQYRAGKHQMAAETLAHCDRHREHPDPGDLAFLAMAQHRLGQHKEAQASLERLRTTMKEPRHARNEENQAFLREAEGLLQPESSAPDKADGKQQ